MIKVYFVLWFEQLFEENTNLIILCFHTEVMQFKTSLVLLLWYLWAHFISLSPPEHHYNVLKTVDAWGCVCTQRDVCAELPVASKSGSQLGRQPTPSLCLWVSLVLSPSYSADFSALLSCPFWPDSSPEGISARESSQLLIWWQEAVKEFVFNDRWLHHRNCCSISTSRAIHPTVWMLFFIMITYFPKLLCIHVPASQDTWHFFS